MNREFELDHYCAILLTLGFIIWATLRIIKNKTAWLRDAIDLLEPVAEDKHISVVMRDTGTAIAEPELCHIFDRFYGGEKRRSHLGSSLGLSLTRTFVLAHGGTIAVTSVSGEGSKFTITPPKDLL